MIGIRTVVPAALALLVCAGLLPASVGAVETRIAADRLVAVRADVAVTALEALADALAPAVEAGRRGAARIVTGDEPPSTEFADAAQAVLEAQALARNAVRAVEVLDAARLARDPDAEPIGGQIDAGALASISGQLSATGAAGDEFADLRRGAQAVAASLATALDALAAGDLEASDAAVTEARRAHEAVAAWEDPPDALPVWIETTAAMIGSMDGLVAATRAGDVEGAERAAEKLAELEAEADTADRALRISVSEGGNAIAATALGRLAGVLDAVASTRERVSPVDR